MTMGPTLVNSLFFLIILLTQTLGTLAGYSGSSALVGALILMLHLRLKGWASHEVKTLLTAFLFGGAFEGLAVHQEWIRYQGSAGYHAIPWWILILWMSVGLLFGGALHRLKPHPLQAFFLGGCMGMLFVMAGEQVGLLMIPDPASDLKWMGLGWGVGFACLTALTRRFESQDPKTFTAETRS